METKVAEDTTEVADVDNLGFEEIKLPDEEGKEILKYKCKSCSYDSNCAGSVKRHITIKHVKAFAIKQTPKRKLEDKEHMDGDDKRKKRK